MTLLINGQSTHQLSASDRGLQYGDGLFETIAVIDGAPRLWERHMARLELGERRLGMPGEDKRRLREEADRLISELKRSRAVLKLLVTRGQGGRGYRPPSAPATTRILSLHPWPEISANWYTDGIRLRLCATRIGSSPRLAGLKHLNRLEQVLARQEWDNPDIPEGLMLDDQGHPIEGTQSNIFLLRDGQLFTPDLSRCGIAGVVRELAMEVASDLGIKTSVTQIDLDEIDAAEALFITNSLLGICPVSAFEGRQFDPRKIPEALMKRVHDLCFGIRAPFPAACT